MSDIKKFDDFQLNEKIEDDLGREYVSEDDAEDDAEDGIFIRNDGWDKEALENVELIDWLAKVYDFSYEINSCRRGSYAIEGDTASDLLNSLREIQEQLKIVVERIEDEILDYENHR